MLDLLLKIQQDREIIKKAEKVLKERPNNDFMKEKKKQFDEKKSEYKNVDSKLKMVKESIEQFEKKLQDVRKELKQEEGKLYGNMKYDLKFINTLEKSIKLKEDEIKDLEEKSLDMMCEEEDLSKERDVLRKKLIDIKDEFYENKKFGNDKIIETKKNMEEAEKDILNCEKKLPPRLLDKFNELCSVKGTGAAKILNGVCSGCRMKVSAVTIDEIKNHKNIVYCDNCGRIIYYGGVSK